MLPRDQLEIRERFKVPDAYVKLFSAGGLDPENPHSLILSDTDFLSPEEIAGFELPDYWRPDLIPMARTGRGDLWCWYPEWAAGNDVPIIFALHDLDTGNGYAPHFAGALYRLLLEEMSSSWLVGGPIDSAENLHKAFVRNAEIVAPVLTPQMNARINELLSRPVQETEEGAFGVLSPEEAEQVIAANLAFGMLEAPVRIHR